MDAAGVWSSFLHNHSCETLTACLPIHGDLQAYIISGHVPQNRPITVNRKHFGNLACPVLFLGDYSLLTPSTASPMSTCLTPTHTSTGKLPPEAATLFLDDLVAKGGYQAMPCKNKPLLCLLDSAWPFAPALHLEAIHETSHL